MRSYSDAAKNFQQHPPPMSWSGRQLMIHKTMKAEWCWSSDYGPPKQIISFPGQWPHVWSTLTRATFRVRDMPHCNVAFCCCSDRGPDSNKADFYGQTFAEMVHTSGYSYSYSGCLCRHFLYILWPSSDITYHTKHLTYINIASLICLSCQLSPNYFTHETQATHVILITRRDTIILTPLNIWTKCIQSSLFASLKGYVGVNVLLLHFRDDCLSFHIGYFCVLMQNRYD